MANDVLLTTLDHVKDWLGIEESNTSSDAYLLRLIKSASQFALNYMQRDSMSSNQYDEIYDGYGNTFMMLRQFPATEILALSLNGTPVSAAGGDGISTPFSNGYVLETPKSAPSQQRLTLFNKIFPHMRSSVYVSYMAGYKQVGERHVVPDDPGPYTVDTNYTWLEDLGVTLLDGTPLVKIEEPASDLMDLQYSVSDDGTYTFSDYQALTPVLITYSYVPADVEQAVWELVGERYRAQERIGMSSKSLGGQETVSYDIRAMNPYIRELLNPYKRVVPV